MQQLIKGRPSRGDGDYGQGIGVRSVDVARSISHNADLCAGAGQLSGLLRRVADQLRPNREEIAETAETKPFAQACFFDLDPANGFKIARSHSQQCPLLCQMAQSFFHARHQDRIQLLPPLGNAVPHGFKDGVVMLFEHVVGNASAWRQASRRMAVSVLPWIGTPAREISNPVTRWTLVATES